MNKKFMYFEHTDGGMNHWLITEGSLEALPGWFRGDCVKPDTALLVWLTIAEVGEYFEHRMGVVVRLKDE